MTESTNEQTDPTNAQVYKAPGKLALSTQILSAVFIATDLIVSSLEQYGNHLSFIGSEDLANKVYDIYDFATVIHAIVLVAAGISLMLFVRRAYRNLQCLNVTGLSNPEWACTLGFIVPIANVYFPWAVTNEIWKASNPLTVDSLEWKQSKDSELILAWWGSFFGYNIANGFFQLSAVNQMTSAPIWLSPSFAAAVILALINCATGVLLILVVREITARQEKKYELLNSTPDQ